eukprot:gene2206-biopygen2117
METLKRLRHLSKPEDWCFTFYLQDRYYLVRINLPFQEFMQFEPLDLQEPGAEERNAVHVDPARLETVLSCRHGTEASEAKKGTVGVTSADGLTHMAYGNGDEEYLNMSKEHRDVAPATND